MLLDGVQLVGGRVTPLSGQLPLGVFDTIASGEIDVAAAQVPAALQAAAAALGRIDQGAGGQQVSVLEQPHAGSLPGGHRPGLGFGLLLPDSKATAPCPAGLSPTPGRGSLVPPARWLSPNSLHSCLNGPPGSLGPLSDLAALHSPLTPGHVLLGSRGISDPLLLGRSEGLPTEPLKARSLLPTVQTLLYRLLKPCGLQARSHRSSSPALCTHPVGSGYLR